MMPSRWFSLAFVLLAASCSSTSDSSQSTTTDDSSTSDDSNTTGDDTGTSGDDSGTTADGTTPDDTGTTPSDGATTDTGTTGGDTGTTPTDGATSGNHLKYVWIIVEENHSWSSIKGSSQAPYINSLLTATAPAAHAEKYSDNGLHPSEPNYIWMEAGDNLGITDDNDPDSNSQSTTNHLSTMLDTAKIDWKSWQEDMPDPTKCPLSSKGNYGAKHNPFVFFEDVTNNNSATSAHCIAHMANTTQLETDLAAGKVPPYNFITPNLCNDMHGAATCLTNNIKQGDDWLKNIVPKIQATKQYKDAGVIFIVWDEGSGSGTNTIGLIAISPFAKPGFADTTNTYTHSSLLRTVQTIFGVSPFIRDAAKAKDLGNLFTAFP